jgi:hypothetical protein
MRSDAFEQRIFHLSFLILVGWIHMLLWTIFIQKKNAEASSPFGTGWGQGLR